MSRRVMHDLTPNWRGKLVPTRQRNASRAKFRSVVRQAGRVAGYAAAGGTGGLLLAQVARTVVPLGDGKIVAGMALSALAGAAVALLRRQRQPRARVVEVTLNGEVVDRTAQRATRAAPSRQPVAPQTGGAGFSPRVSS